MQFLFRIPSIETLSAFDYSTKNAAWVLETRGIGPRSSSITDLSLVCDDLHVPTAGDVSALLSTPRTLTRLRIY